MRAAVALSLFALLACARAQSPAPCDRDMVVVAGGCVAARVGDAYCGSAARFVGGRCVFATCEPGQLMDVASGACVTSRDVRSRARAAGVDLAPDDAIACDGGRVAIADGDDLACIGGDAICPRGTRASNGRCVASPRCPAFAVAEDDACMSLVVAGSSSAPYAVDIAAWSRATLGRDGGPGARDLCAPLALRPAAFGTSDGSARVVRVEIALRVPGNLIESANAHVRVVDAVTGVPLEARAAAIAEAAVAPLVEALRSVGGESSVAAADISVLCEIDSRQTPHAVPRARRGGVDSTHS